MLKSFQRWLQRRFAMLDYEQAEAAIRTDNQQLLDAFQVSLKAAELTDKTIKTHLTNLDFLGDYLANYEPLRRLDEADEADVCSFLLEWYPRKAMWASPSQTQSLVASFRKFYRFLGETRRMNEKRVSKILASLKRGRDAFLAAVEVDDFEDEW